MDRGLEIKKALTIHFYIKIVEIKSNQVNFWSELFVSRHLWLKSNKTNLLHRRIVIEARCRDFVTGSHDV